MSSLLLCFLTGSHPSCLWVQCPADQLHPLCRGQHPAEAEEVQGWVSASGTGPEGNFWRFLQFMIWLMKFPVKRGHVWEPVSPLKRFSDSSRCIQIFCPTRRSLSGKREFDLPQSWSSFITRRWSHFHTDTSVLYLYKAVVPKQTSWSLHQIYSKGEVSGWCPASSFGSWLSGPPAWASNIPFSPAGGLISAS